jgi:hypothetical protein
MKVPKVYTLPTVHVGAEHYVPPRTTDPLAAEWRRSARGTHALILEQQGFGLQVANEVLDDICGQREEHVWAQHIGATMLLSAKYMFGLRDTSVMSHRIPIPEIARHDDRWGSTIISPIEYETMVQKAFDRRIREAAEISDSLANEYDSTRAINTGARSLATLGVMMANYPMDPTWFDQIESAATYQQQVVDNAHRMHQEGVDLARKIGTVPSLAQLADVSSPLSSYLRSNRHYPIQLVRSLKNAQEDIIGS